MAANLGERALFTQSAPAMRTSCECIGQKDPEHVMPKLMHVLATHQTGMKGQHPGGSQN